VSALIDFEKIARSRQSSTILPPVVGNIGFKSSLGEEVIVNGDKVYTLADSLRLTTTDNTAQVFIDGRFIPIGNGYSLKLIDGSNRIGIFQNSPGVYSGTMLWRAWRWYEISHGSSFILMPIKGTGNIEETLSFRVKTNLPPGSKLEYDWSSGDGRNFLRTTLDTFNISYNKPGIFSVRVTVRDMSTGDDLGSDTAEAIVLGPQVSILPIKDTGYIGSEIKFVAKVLNNPIEGVFFEWTAPEGQIIGGNIKDTFKVTYGQNGTYPIILRMINLADGKELGKATTAAHVVEPTLVITPISQGLYVGNLITFKVNYQSTLIPLIYEWDAGDGVRTATSNLNSESFAYIRPSTYSLYVKIKVKSSGIVIGQAVLPVTISEYPYKILPGINKVFANEIITFGTVPRHSLSYHLRYEWDFGDGSGLTIMNDSNIAQHAYKNEGSYSIKLTIVELSSNVVQGRDQVSVQVLPIQLPPTLAHLHQMKYINITFNGAHNYSSASPASGSQIAIVNKPITWNNSNFSAASSSFYPGSLTPTFDTLILNGEISAEQNSVKHVNPYHHNQVSILGPNNGGGSYSDRKENLIDLKAQTISLSEVTADTIRFRVNGFNVSNVLLSIKFFHSWSYHSSDRHGNGTSGSGITNYLSTNWASYVYEPYFEITFCK
jgi:PKD repeat protein